MKLAISAPIDYDTCVQNQVSDDSAYLWDRARNALSKVIVP